MKHLAQYLVPSKWEEEGTWRDAGNPEGSLALSVAYSEAKGQLSEKRKAAEVTTWGGRGHLRVWRGLAPVQGCVLQSLV